MRRLIEWVENHTRALLIAMGGLLGLAALLWWAFFYQARLTIQVDPPSAAVTIDERTYQQGEVAKLKPGSHTVRATLTDHIPLEQSLTVGSNQYRTLSIELRTTPGLELVTSDGAFGAAIDRSAQTISYVNATRQRAERLRLSGTGKPVVLTLTNDGAFAGVDEVHWSPSPTLALVRRGDRWSLYDFERSDLVHQRELPWPSGIGAVSWHPVVVTTEAHSPAGDVGPNPSATQPLELIHYYAPGDGEQTLVRTDPLHTALDRLTNLRESGLDRPDVVWVGDGTDVVLRSAQLQLWRFGAYSRQLAPITQSDRVTGFLPSPDGTQLLYRTDQGTLFLIGSDGANRRPVELSVSLERAAWSADNQVIWAVTGDDSLAVERITVSDGARQSFAVAANQSVGSLTGVVVTDNQQQLVVVGSAGVALLRLEAGSYPPLTVK